MDNSKAFDKVKHQEMVKMLQELDIDGKDMQKNRNLYWEQKAAVRVDHEVGKYCNMKRGFRQECVFLSDLFSLYSENIHR